MKLYLTIRIKVGRKKYLIWDNKGLEFGEGTDTEDLWLSDYEAYPIRVLGFKVMIMKKRNLSRSFTELR